MNHTNGKTAFSLHIEGGTQSGAGDAPKKIIDAVGHPDIRELDLSPITVDSVKVGNLALKAKQGVTLEPVIDETQQLICATDAGLGFDAFARSREALVGELNEQIGMLWQEYAQADNESLDGAAIKMKQALLAAFSELADGR
jgi:hypothetical protein